MRNDKVKQTHVKSQPLLQNEVRHAQPVQEIDDEDHFSQYYDMAY
jgi:hypothetical protein